MDFQAEAQKKLGRTIKDLEDVRQAMVMMEAIRKQYIDIDMSLGPIEVCNRPTYLFCLFWLKIIPLCKVLNTTFSFPSISLFLY